MSIKIGRRHIVKGGVCLAALSLSKLLFAEDGPQALDHAGFAGTEPKLNLDKKYQDKSRSMALMRNEASKGMSPRVNEYLAQAAGELHQYNFGFHFRKQLKAELSATLGVEIGQIILSPGSLSGLGVAIQALSNKGTTYVSHDHEYDLHQAVVRGLNLSKATVPCTPEYKINLGQLIRVAKPNSIIYFSNPHLPFGGFLSAEVIEEFLGKINPSASVIIDECYIQFNGGDFNAASAIGLTKKFPNLIISRSFSKAYGLASIRLGYLVAGSAMIGRLAPKKSQIAGGHAAELGVSGLSAVAGLVSLADRSHFEANLTETARLRVEMSTFATENHLRVTGPYGNFITFVMPDHATPELIRPAMLPYAISSGYFNKRPYVRFSLGNNEALAFARRALIKLLKTS